MSAGWNISLFHYRNHGADYGRVLVGMQVPPKEKGEFKEFLKKPWLRALERTTPPTNCSSAKKHKGVRQK
jgi:threonine dehydratase